MRLTTWAAMSCLLAVSSVPAQTLPTTQSNPPAVTTTPAKADGALVAELKAMEERLSKVQDLTTKFVQEKHTAVLRKPLTSTGTIRIKQNLMRWDTEKPQPSSMLISDQDIRLYYPKQKLIEIYKIDQQLARMAASPIPRIAVMQEHFDFGPMEVGELDPQADGKRFLALRLTPKQETLKQHIDELHLLIDRESAYLRRMEMIDADGDRTVIRFDDVKLNSGLSEDDLELKTPEGTRVSRPIPDGESGQ